MCEINSKQPKKSIFKTIKNFSLVSFRLIYKGEVKEWSREEFINFTFHDDSYQKLLQKFFTDYYN